MFNLFKRKANYRKLQRDVKDLLSHIVAKNGLTQKENTEMYHYIDLAMKEAADVRGEVRKKMDKFGVYGRVLLLLAYAIEKKIPRNDTATKRNVYGLAIELVAEHANLAGENNNVDELRRTMHFTFMLQKLKQFI